MNEHILPVELEKAYRLLNHGPTVLVLASQAGTNDVMAAAWSCALDFAPPKVTVCSTTATGNLKKPIRAGAAFITSLEAQFYAIGESAVVDTTA